MSVPAFFAGEYYVAITCFQAWRHLHVVANIQFGLGCVQFWQCVQYKSELQSVVMGALQVLHVVPINTSVLLLL